MWNATVAVLQFLTADLEPHILSSATEQVYAASFYTTSMHLLHQQPEEVLFSHFVTTLNAAFENKLALEDEGYESGSESFNLPTPLRKTSRIHHVYSVATSPLVLLLHIPQPPASQIASLYTADCHSLAQMKKTALQFTAH